MSSATRKTTGLRQWKRPTKPPWERPTKPSQVHVPFGGSLGRIRWFKQPNPVHPSYYTRNQGFVRSMVLVELEPLGLTATSWFAWMPWASNGTKDLQGHLLGHPIANLTPRSSTLPTQVSPLLPLQEARWLKKRKRYTPPPPASSGLSNTLTGWGAGLFQHLPGSRCLGILQRSFQLLSRPFSWSSPNRSPSVLQFPGE